MLWTAEKIKAQAPDESTDKRGRGLAFPYRWSSLKSNGTFVWGEYKTGGNYPYKVAVHLGEAQFKCTCPVRKKPCKHNIAILYLSLLQSDAFRITYELPEWVENWYNRKQRLANAENKPKSAEEIEKAEARKAANRLKRINSIKAGADDLETWLQDIIRQGVASMEDQKHNSGFWKDIAARMVDNKMSGIGRRIRELQYIMNSNSEWPQQMLLELGSLHLLAKSLQRLETLPEDYQQMLLEMTGLASKKEELLAQEGIQDIWTIIGQIEGVNVDNAPFRKTWLRGNRSQRMFYIMEYDYQGLGFQEALLFGNQFQGVLALYPSPYPLRAIVKEQQERSDLLVESKAITSIDTALAQFTKACALNPWIKDFPMLLHDLTPVKQGKKILAVDQHKKAIRIQGQEASEWKILALSAGKAINIFGEWDGNRFFPLSITTEGRFIPL